VLVQDISNVKVAPLPIGSASHHHACGEATENTAITLPRRSVLRVKLWCRTCHVTGGGHLGRCVHAGAPLQTRFHGKGRAGNRTASGIGNPTSTNSSTNAAVVRSVDLANDRPPASTKGVDISGHPSSPSSFWLHSVSTASRAIAVSSSHFCTSPPRRSADRWAKSKACTAIAAGTAMARPLR
jgi:hypothetical protein